MGYHRGEVAATIIMDGLLLLLVVAVRGMLLWLLHRFSAPDVMAWSVRVVELLLDFGLVGTVLVMTVFDLAKRMRNAYRAWSDNGER